MHACGGLTQAYTGAPLQEQPSPCGKLAAYKGRFIRDF
jgi:hypothetical protein